MRVSACGVCRTDLHLAVGELAPKHPRVVPGHEVVGVGRRGGPGLRAVPHRRPGRDRVAAAHVRAVPMVPARAGEPLPVVSHTPGWDADGGYAEYAVVDEAYAYALPDAFDDEHAAPLLCAGIIGYRALLRAELPPGGRLGIYGFGASAHLAAQVAMAQGATRARAHAVGRGAGARARARRRVGRSGPTATPPEPLDSRDPLRARRRAGAAGAAGARPGRHPGARRHLPVADPGARLRPRPVPGAPAPQRHLEHPRRRRRLPAAGRRIRHLGAHDAVPARPGRRRARDLAHDRAHRRRGAGTVA